MQVRKFSSLNSRTNHSRAVVFHTENQPHKQHFWFFSDTIANAEKTKRAVFYQRSNDIEESRKQLN